MQEVDYIPALPALLQAATISTTSRSSLAYYLDWSTLDEVIHRLGVAGAVLQTPLLLPELLID